MTQTPEEKIDFASQRWREQGFYHYFDEKLNSWCFLADRKGMEMLSDRLRAYAKNPLNKKLSEHEHFGPYMDFEIMTSNLPEIDSHAVSGSPADLMKLADLIKTQLAKAKVGDTFFIDKDYSPKNDTKLEFRLQTDGFDPASGENID